MVYLKNIQLFFVFIFISFFITFTFFNYYQLKQCKKTSSLDKLELYADALSYRLKKSTKRLNKLEMQYNHITKAFTRYRGVTHLVSSELFLIANEAQQKAIDEAKYHRVYMSPEDQMEQFMLDHRDDTIKDLLDSWLEEGSQDELSESLLQDDFIPQQQELLDGIDIKPETLVKWREYHLKASEDRANGLDFFEQKDIDPDLVELVDLEEGVSSNVSLDRAQAYCKKLYEEYSVDRAIMLEDMPTDMQKRFILFSCDSVL